MDNTSTCGKWRHLVQAYMDHIFPAAAFYVALFFPMYFVYRQKVAAPTRWGSLVYLCAIGYFCVALVLLGALFQRKSLPFRMLLWNLIWITVTRLLFGGLAVFRESNLVRWFAVFTAAFASIAYLRPKPRKLLLQLVTVEFSAVMAVWAVLGIATALVGHSVAGVSGIHMGFEKNIVYIQYFYMHRNLSASFFICAIGLLLIQCAVCRKKWIWISAAVLVPLWYLSVALLHSRSCYLACAALLTMTLYAFLREKLDWEKRWIGKGLGLCALLVCVLLVYATFNLSSSGLMAATSGLRASAAAETAENASAGAQEEAILTVADERSTLRDATTLSSRVLIWKAGIAVVLENPRIALLGEPGGGSMALVRIKMNAAPVHMHNILFEQMLVSGIPGMLLCAVFLLALLWRMACCYLGRRRETALSVMAALLASLMIYGMFEPLFDVLLPAPSTLLCLAAGAFTQGFDEAYGRLRLPLPAEKA